MSPTVTITLICMGPLWKSLLQVILWDCNTGSMLGVAL